MRVRSIRTSQQVLMESDRGTCPVSPCNPAGVACSGGHFSTYTGNHNLIRLRPDGAFDGSFAAKGRCRKGSVRSVTVAGRGVL